MSDLRISKESYYKHFNLLKEHGYIQVEQEKNQDGYFDRNIYTLLESVPCPKYQDTDSDLPCPKYRDTDLRYTEKQDIIKVTDSKSNSIYNYQSVSQDKPDRRTEIEIYQEIIRENVGYQDLLHTHAADMNLVDEFVDIILDAVLSKSETVRISGEDKPRELVKGVLMKLAYRNIVHVLEQFKGQESKIKKKRQYILSMLYHSGLELDAHYTNLVKSDWG